MQSEDYVAMVSNPDFLGDPLLQTQHLIGMSRWDKIADDYIVGHHQLRAANMRYADASRTVQKMSGHAHATNEHYYRKVDGQWKFAGLKPTIRWNEDSFDKVFSKH
jgi:scytalone dehydratase